MNTFKLCFLMFRALETKTDNFSIVIMMIIGECKESFQRLEML